MAGRTSGSGGGRRNLKEDLVGHVNEFELDVEGSESLQKDFRLRDGIMTSILKDESGCYVGEEMVSLEEET